MRSRRRRIEDDWLWCVDMAIFGISDLHLSFSSEKPMDIFGDHWRDHASRMAAQWDAIVGPDDIVLCPGDLSWAMRLDDAKADLEWISARTGRLKVIGRGNHDYWWSAIGRVRKALPPTLVALQNDAIDLGDVVVSGSRCWSAPGALDWGAADEKIFQREVHRLRMSLDEGKKLAAGRPLIAAIHYPPFNARGEATSFATLIDEFNVTTCVYGHLHGRHAHRTAVTGDVEKTRYHLIACDFIDFAPIQIWPPPADGPVTRRGPTPTPSA